MLGEWKNGFILLHVQVQALNPPDPEWVHAVACAHVISSSVCWFANPKTKRNDWLARVTQDGTYWPLSYVPDSVLKFVLFWQGILFPHLPRIIVHEGSLQLDAPINKSTLSNYDCPPSHHSSTPFGLICFMGKRAYFLGWGSVCLFN